jgi:hypothetical protein
MSIIANPCIFLASSCLVLDAFQVYQAMISTDYHSNGTVFPFAKDIK